jgi:hypothetical protein
LPPAIQCDFSKRKLLDNAAMLAFLAQVHIFFPLRAIPYLIDCDGKTFERANNDNIDGRSMFIICNSSYCFSFLGSDGFEHKQNASIR